MFSELPELRSGQYISTDSVMIFSNRVERGRILDPL